MQKPESYLIQAIIVGLVIAAIMFICPGCSHSVLVGSCDKVENQNKNVCKTLKLWE